MNSARTWTLRLALLAALPLGSSGAALATENAAQAALLG